MVSRGPCRGCPHKLKCRNQFVAIADEIKTFRALLCDGSTTRKKTLCGLLKQACAISETGGKEITFSVAGKHVCKNFYREATGFTRQLFDKCVLEVLDPSKVGLRHKLKRPPTAETKSKILAILDLIFGELSVKQDPTKHNHKISCRCTWRDIYEKDFKKYAGGAYICDINKFNRVRRAERKNYRKSPRMTKGKHIEYITFYSLFY